MYSSACLRRCGAWATTSSAEAKAAARLVHIQHEEHLHGELARCTGIASREPRRPSVIAVSPSTQYSLVKAKGRSEARRVAHLARLLAAAREKLPLIFQTGQRSGEY